MTEGRRCSSPKVETLLIPAKSDFDLISGCLFSVYNILAQEGHSVGGNHSICSARLCVLFIVFTSIYFLIQLHEAGGMCVISTQ